MEIIFYVLTSLAWHDVAVVAAAVVILKEKFISAP